MKRKVTLILEDKWIDKETNQPESASQLEDYFLTEVVDLFFEVDLIIEKVKVEDLVNE